MKLWKWSEQRGSTASLRQDTGKLGSVSYVQSTRA